MPKTEGYQATPMGSVNFGPSIAQQTAHFWRMQDEMLKEAETFLSNWFKRRHEATRTALQAGAAVRVGDPAAAMKAIADWQLHSAQRLSQDAQECWSMMSRCACNLVREEIEAAEDAAEQTAKTAKGATARAVPV